MFFNFRCLKALYTQTSSSRVRNDLKALAQREPNKQVRQAAIWTLFAASGDNRTRDVLVDIARNSSDMDLRVEALKSLYNGMGNSRLRNTVRDTARNTSTDARLRFVSILLLSRIQDSRTRDVLQYIAQRDANDELRAAAIMAMNPGDDRIRAYFHLVRRDANGRAIDPLDDE